MSCAVLDYGAGKGTDGGCKSEVDGECRGSECKGRVGEHNRLCVPNVDGTRETFHSEH